MPHPNYLIAVPELLRLSADQQAKSLGLSWIRGHSSPVHAEFQDFTTKLRLAGQTSLSRLRIDVKTRSYARALPHTPQALPSRFSSRKRFHAGQPIKSFWGILWTQ